jgi:hypothetical protein
MKDRLYLKSMERAGAEEQKQPEKNEAVVKRPPQARSTSHSSAVLVLRIRLKESVT